MADDREVHQGGTIGDIIIGSLNRYRERPAFVAGERHMSYAQTAEAISRLIQLFSHIGLTRGDTILQVGRNSPEQWFVTAACYIMGLRSVTMHPNVTLVDEQAWVISFSDASLVISDRSAEPIDNLKDRCRSVRSWYSHGIGEPGARHLWTEAEAFAPKPIKNLAGPDDIIRLGFTSGTTGRRKGVLLSNRAIVAMTMISVVDSEWPETPRVLCAEPIAGGFGNMILPTLLRGGTFIMETGFEPDQFIDAVEFHQPNVLLFMPPALYALLDHPRTVKTEWSHLSLLVYSGANLPISYMREALRVFGPVLCQVYGQTECPKSLAVLRKADHASGDEKLLGALGLPCSGISVALLNDELQECEPGQIGELCVRGSIVASGYWKESEATKRALRGGWWHTGDLCVTDAHGYLYFVDRAVDTAIQNGTTVYPKVIEDLLMTHPDVKDAAVIAITEPASVAAIVTLRNGARVDEETLQMFVGAKSPVVLTSVHFIERLPCLAIARVDKKALRERYGSA